MRIAALYDIHANLPALEVVLREIAKAGVDQVVVGGDVVPGPMPRETLDCLRELEVPVQFIRGNGEVAVLTEMMGRDSGVPAPFREGVRWNAQQLRPEDAQLIESWPGTLRLTVDDIDVLFCHATPRNENEIFTRTTAEERGLPAFEGVDVPLVVCGHTHMQFDRMIGRIRVVNAGSVGMPFGEPGAYWLLLDGSVPETRGGHSYIAVQLHRTSYDVAAAAERIRASGYPQAEEFAARNVLQPPTEAAMLEAFAKAEM